MTDTYEPAGLLIDQTAIAIEESRYGASSGRLVRVLGHDGWTHAIAAVRVIDGAVVLILGEAIDPITEAERAAYADVNADLT